MDTATQNKYDVLKEAIFKRYRFDKIDNMLPTTESLEVEAAIADAVEDINAFPPETSYTFDWIYEGNDPRWRRMLYIAAAKNICEMLLADWAANGFDAQIDDLNVNTKIGDYQTLYTTLDEQWNKKMEQLKGTSQKSIQGITAANQSPLYSGNGTYNIFVNRTR